MDGYTLLFVFWLLSLGEDVSTGPAKYEIHTAEHGNISARFHGNESDANVTWLIMADEYKVIKLDMINFSTPVEYVHLEILDGNTSLGKFGGNHAVRTFVSRSSTVHLYFLQFLFGEYLSRKYITSWGYFFATYTQVERSERTCDFMRITDHSGSLAYPENGLETVYPFNADCTWLLFPSPDKKMQINITFMDIQYHRSCSYDYLEVYDIQVVYGKFCGTQQLPPITSSDGPLMIFFHSDTAVQGRGFSAAYTEVDMSYQSCGDLTTLTAQSGFIRSPSPDIDGIYAYPTYCKWMMIAEEYHVLLLEILYFDVPIPWKSDWLGCVQSYHGYGMVTGYKHDLLSGLQVKNGDAYYHFCGGTKPPAITSTGQTLELAFSYFDTIGAFEDIPLQGRGFNATYYQAHGEVCSFFYVQMKGYINSVDKNLDGFYENNMDCSWVVWTNDVRFNQIVQFYILSIDIPSGQSCQHDYLKIYDRTTLVGVYCGSIQPPVINASHYMLLEFHSNKRLRGKGFSGIFNIIDRDGFCGGIFPALAGEIAHNGLRSQSSWLGVYSCEWVIVVPDNRGIQLKFIYIDFPETYDCSSNHVKVSDKAWLNDVFCGSELPDIITTSSSIMNITMGVSHNFGLFRHKGFMATYTSTHRDCGGILTLPSGKIELIDDRNDDTSGFDLNCIWIISSPQISIVEIDFYNISLSDRSNCTGDFLKLYVDRFAEEAMKMTICVWQQPPAINLTTTLVYLHFAAANKASSWTGFQANYRIIPNAIKCGGFLNATTAYFNLTISLDDKAGTSNCQWHIQARNNHVVELKLLRIYMSVTNGCEKDFLKVFDGASDKGDLIAKFCGTQVAPLLVSSGRSMFVYFSSENGSDGDGFEAVYAESKGIPDQCGSMLSGSEGFIKSPDNDNDGNYDNGMKCDWTIITEPGTIVKLIVQSLVIEPLYMKRNSPCRYDRFMVFDGSNDQSPLFGIWCGPWLDATTFRSSSNSLHVQFISDNSINERGFYVTFTAVEEDAWKKWPDADYSIPMSIYGCPQQDINDWKHGYINLTFNVPLQTTVSSFGKLNQYQDLFTLGPIGKNSIQLNFCTKVKSNITSNDAEWPRGIYVIYRGHLKCPAGFELFDAVIATGDLSWTSAGKIPRVSFLMLSDGLSNFMLHLCIKFDTTIDAHSMRVSDLQEPFIVLSPKLSILNPNIIVDKLAEVNETTMLHPNLSLIDSSMTVVVEAYNMQTVTQSSSRMAGLTFWVVKPRDMVHFARTKKGKIKTTNLSTLVLGIPPTDNVEDQIWMAYDLSRAVLVSGIRFLQNDRFAASDDVIDFEIPLILLSNEMWHYMNHGAWYCIPYTITWARQVDVYCVNHQDYLSVRYVTLKEKNPDRSSLKKLRSRAWSVWILSDNSYSGTLLCRESLGMEHGLIHDFQISKSSVVYRRTGSESLMIGEWCFPTSVPRKFEFIQIDLLQPTKIEEIKIYLETTTYNNRAYLNFLYSNNLTELSTQIGQQNMSIDTTASKIVYTFEPSVTARYLKVEVLPRLLEICMTFKLIGCLRSNLKSFHRTKSNDCQLRESRFILHNYFFEQHALALTNVTLDECIFACNEDDRCSAVKMGTNCTRFNTSSSQSYSRPVGIDRNDVVYLKICSAEESYKTIPFLLGNLTWNDITTLVREPGIIVSHDYPFRYSYGQLWCWKIFFDASVTVNLVLYNVSFDRSQVFPQASNYKMRFHDYMDRLFLTSGAFDADMLLTDRLVADANGVIAIVDRTLQDAVPHYITNSDTVKIFLRTVIQSTPVDSMAAGFRLLAYPTDETICLPFTNCQQNSAVIRSKSLMGDYASSNEVWHISSDVNEYIFLQFYTFDIGCQSDSVLEVAVSTTEKQKVCNINKPFGGIKSHGKHMTVTFTMIRRESYLIEGFEARYSMIHKPYIDPELLYTEEIKNVNLSESVSTIVFKVCSEHFKKCYLLIGNLQEIYGPEMASWSFVSTSICARHNWTMPSLHSKVEQEFIGSMLFKKFVLTNQAAAFIGLRRGIQSYSDYKWNDNSPVTYTNWGRGHPSPDLYMRCAAMTLSLSVDYTWESIPCDEPKEAVAVCQMEWTSTNTSLPHQETVYFTGPQPSPLLSHHHIRDTKGLDDKRNKHGDKTQAEPIDSDRMTTTSLWKCKNTETISILGRCNNVTDCFDGSDELDCAYTEGSCSQLEFRCGDGRCISISVLCDFIPDCTDNSDEECYFPPCNGTHFRCSNHKCIPLSQRCDGKNDCFDESDEYDCAISDCNNKNSFLCSSSYCIPRIFVCDGIADCTSGVDELNCQFPESCQKWWDAGYHKNGFYEAGDSNIECDFEQGLVNNSILTKFNNIDHGRNVSHAEKNAFTYSAQDVLMRHIQENTCYLTVDQLCQPWVQRLYDIDERQESQGSWSKMLHACQCVRHMQKLISNNMTLPNYRPVTGCDGREVFPDEVFHIEFETNSSDGLVYSMSLKPGHEFDVGMLKIIFHPIVCFSDFEMSISNITCGFGFTAAPETRCLYKEDEFGHIVGCRSLRHLQNCETFSCPGNYFKCPNSFCIEKRYVCDGVTHCQGGEDELGCDKMVCLPGYRCLNSDICLHQQYLCDGYPQCPLGDDERLCHFTCPQTCTCSAFAVNCTNNSINDRKERIVIPYITRMLDISGNERAWSNISFIQDKLEYLVHLNISGCGIRRLSLPVFSFIRNLRVLDLSWNYLDILPTKLFQSQTRLKTFRFVNNRELLTIQSEAFLGLDSIGFLNLNHLRVQRIRSRAFAALNLDFLDLTENVINYCEDNTFATLQVKKILLNASLIKEMSNGVFKGIESVDLLVTDSVKYCCIKPYFLPRENCLPPENEISSCDDLLRNEIIRTLAWIVGLIALIANTLSFIYRLHDKERLNIGYGIFVTNLTISDFFMGVYLLIIAGADMEYRSVYYLNDDTWRNSWLCQLAGVLSLFSTESSVLFICFITLDRLLVIKFPFGRFRMTKKISWICVVVSWLIGLFVATFPVVFMPYFKGNFYSRSGVCLALPLSKDVNSGWQYSVVIFIGFNFVSFLLIAAGQWFIFNEVTTTTRTITSKSRSSRKKELRVARNLFLVALTNFLCWAPVAFLGALMLSGQVISGETYAWTAVFVLPINSALNPFLYTLMAIVKKEAMVPETDENVKTLTFPKDQVEEFFKVWRNAGFFMKFREGFEPLSSLLDQNRLSLQQAIQVSKEILKLLHSLHVRSIAHHALVADDIFVQINSNDMLNVTLDSRPELATKVKLKAENIKSFGHLLSTMLDVCNKNTGMRDSESPKKT